MLKFYRGLFLLISGVVLCFPAIGFTWQDLWWRKDQQAMHLLKSRQPNAAAKLFKNTAWRGVANYRAKNFKEAESEFRLVKDKLSTYNLGNTYALEGKYLEALSAYNEAITQDPNNQDAIYNRELIKKLLSENQSKSQENKKDGNNKSKKNQMNKDDTHQENSQNENEKSDQNKADHHSKEDDLSHSNQSQEDSESKQEPGDKAKNETEKQSQSNSNEGQSPKTAKNNDIQKEQKKPGEEERQTQSEQNQTQSVKESGPPSSTQEHAKPRKEVQENVGSGRKNEQQKNLSAQQKERDEATDQWLQQIPDDPGGLLRRKIMRDHLRKLNGTEENF